MRSGRRISGFGVVAVGVFLSGGCVSLDEFKRIQAANRQLGADKEQVAQDLYDERNVNDGLRSRVRQLESENGTKDELIANYRREVELTGRMSDAAQEAMKKMAGTNLGPIVIAGAKLPAPLDSAIKRFAAEHPNEVTYDAAHGSVKWKADLLFPLGSDEVKPSSAESLRGFVEILKSPAAGDFEVVVVGHTDTRPIVKAETKARHPTNWYLSTNRAVAIAGVLQKHGYSPGRIGAMGCSEYRPVADNASEAGGAQNRRVEIYLVPTGSIVFSTATGEARVPRAAEHSAARGNP